MRLSHVLSLLGAAITPVTAVYNNNTCGPNAALIGPAYDNRDFAGLPVLSLYGIGQCIHVPSNVSTILAADINPFKRSFCSFYSEHDCDPRGVVAMMQGAGQWQLSYRITDYNRTNSYQCHLTPVASDPQIPPPPPTKSQSQSHLQSPSPSQSQSPYRVTSGFSREGSVRRHKHKGIVD